MIRTGFAALLLLGACASAPPVNAIPATLAGTNWMRVDDEDAGPHFPSLSFDAARAFGHAGCNRYFAGVAGEGANLRFVGMGATLMACAESSMATERHLFEALERTRAYRIEADELILLDENNAEAARFQPQ